MNPIQDFENLEQAKQVYATSLEAHEDQRFAMAITSKRVRDRMGKFGLNSLAQDTHRKRTTLEAEARVADLADLRGGLPSLQYTHFSVVSRLPRGEAEKWLAKAADSEWSPADLRREIEAVRRQLQTVEVVGKKLDGATDRYKGLIDQASEVGLLDEAVEKVEGLAQYASAKADDKPDLPENPPVYETVTTLENALIAVVREGD